MDSRSRSGYRKMTTRPVVVCTPPPDEGARRTRYRYTPFPSDGDASKVPDCPAETARSEWSTRRPATSWTSNDRVPAASAPKARRSRVAGPPSTFLDRAGWAYEEAALESSSFMKTGRIMAWFTANIGHHHIHHLNARIPSYRLPEARNAIPELTTPKTTSLHPMDIIRCLRLKVWDVESQQMVTLRQCVSGLKPKTA